MKRYSSFFLFAACCLGFLPSFAQNSRGELREKVLDQVSKTSVRQTEKNTPKAAPNRKTTFVYLEHTDIISVDESLRPGVQLLSGNVCFRHDNALMYCDSAYFYQDENSLDAFGNVQIIQGDSVFVYGDVLYYNGNTKLARLRNNVRLEKGDAVLTTDSLNYDRVVNLAYYYTGGIINDKLNALSSVWGQYSPDMERALFHNKVRLVNPNFTMDADTLRYNTRSKVADIVGTTHIVYQDETDIYSTLGWYDTGHERSMLLKRSLVLHKEGKSLVGDTIFYDKKRSFAEAFSQVELTDSINRSTLYGNYVHYNDSTERGLAVDSALLVDWSGEDRMYLHADTLRSFKDSIFNVSLGYYNVRVFRTDIQGICDSLIYSTRDSIICMNGEPVLWAEGSQLSGDSIKAYTKNQKVQRVVIEQSAMASQQVNSEYFNQLSGKEIIAYVDSGAVRKIFVNGNAETIYFPQDESDGLLVGMNKTQSSYVTMYLKAKKVDKILLTTVSTGTMFPLHEAKEKGSYLKNFFWLEEQRPKDEKDVFTYYPKTERLKPAAGSSSPPLQEP